MKKILLTIVSVAFGAMALNAQNTADEIEMISKNAGMVADNATIEFPYSKVMFATKSELQAQKFKYDSNRNQMKLNHTDGFNAVLNVMSDIYTPAKNDYRIAIQYGEDDQISYVEVVFYDSSIYENIMDFAAAKECKVTTVEKGKGKTYSFNYGGYSFRVEYSHKTVSHTDTYTNSSSNGKHAYSSSSTHDFSYDQYVYTVDTGVKPSSDYLKSKEARKEKRALKGKKSKSSADFL